MSLPFPCLLVNHVIRQVILTPFLSHGITRFCKNAKFHGPRPSRPNRPSHFLPSQLLAHNYALIPITFNPGSQFGPLATAFLSASQNKSLTALPYRTDHRCQSGLSSDFAKRLCHKTKSFLPFHIFQHTNTLWRQSSLSHPFTRHFTATKPTQWAVQSLSQSMLIALAAHFNHAHPRSKPLHSNLPSWLSCALYQPASAAPSSSLPCPYSCNLPQLHEILNFLISSFIYLYIPMHNSLPTDSSFLRKSQLTVG